MTATKTNERPGTRAVLRHSGLSASKARQVLDLIRGQDADRAAEILIGTERGAADVIGKVLNSAVSNAAHNDQQNPDELYISACYADEGTTAKRWRPRARGRATRIRKRTSHITIIVSRLPEAKLEQRRKRMEAVSAHRSRRVDASRRRADLSGRLSRRRAAQAVAEAEAEAAAAERDGDGDDADAMAPEGTDVTNPEIETEEDFAAEGGTEAIVVDEANSEDDTAEAPADADEKGE
jgi:large subunit ribosomal protein L22